VSCTRPICYQRLPEQIPPAQLRGAHSRSLAHAMADGLNYSI